MFYLHLHQLLNVMHVAIMLADIDTSFLSKVFRVPAVKGPGPVTPLEPVASPAAPVVAIFKSPIAGRRRCSKFSNPAQTRGNKKIKLRLSSKRKASVSASFKSPQVESAVSSRTTTVEPKV